jgi:hypothetical protein
VAKYRFGPNVSKFKQELVKALQLSDEKLEDLLNGLYGQPGYDKLQKMQDQVQMMIHILTSGSLKNI